MNTASDIKQDSVINLIDAAVEQGRAMAEEKGGIVAASVVVKRRSK